MAYKIMQKGRDGVLKEVVLRGETVMGSDFDPGDVELKQFDDEERSFTAIGSTGNPDRVEDIVDHKGWVLDNFIKNPVGMWAHDYKQLPIFRVPEIEVKPRTKKMIFRAVFDDHEFADTVYQSYKKKFMKGFSVGFLPLEYEMRSRDEMTDEEKARAGFWGGMHFKKQELLEMSAAPIPMHPEALADIKAMGIPTDVEAKCLFPAIKTTMPDGGQWFPIEDPSKFMDFVSYKLGDGVRTINGREMAREDGASVSSIAKVVGYIFPADFEEERIAVWLSKSGLSDNRINTLVGTSTGNSVGLEIGEDGEFKLNLDGASITSASNDVESSETFNVGVEVPTTTASTDDTEDNVEEVVDNVEDVLVKIREPESIVLEEGALIINTELGQITFDVEKLKQFGIEIGKEVLLNVADRDRFEKAIYTIATLLEKNYKLEPVPELDVQPDEEETVLADVGLVLESIRDEAATATEIVLDDGVIVDADSDEFSDIISEVLTEQLGAAVGDVVKRKMREASGNLE